MPHILKLISFDEYQIAVLGSDKPGKLIDSVIDFFIGPGR
jgi:hypothetical protein